MKEWFRRQPKHFTPAARDLVRLFAEDTELQQIVREYKRNAPSSSHRWMRTPPHGSSRSGLSTARAKDIVHRP